MAETLIGVFLEDAARRGDGVVFQRRGAGGWESISSKRALADVEALGLALAELGVARGDRVALLSETRYEWPITDLATLGIGGVVVPIYPTLTAEQCRAILDNAGAKLLVVSRAAQLAKVRTILSVLPAIQNVVVFDGTPLDGPVERAYADLLKRGAELRAQDPAAFRTHAAQGRRDDVATIIYTSGTTGEPKGAMLTHGNVVSDVEACLKLVDLNASDTCLSFLPLSHIFERMAGLYAMLRCGATIAY